MFSPNDNIIFVSIPAKGVTTSISPVPASDCRTVPARHIIRITLASDGLEENNTFTQQFKTTEDVPRPLITRMTAALLRQETKYLFQLILRKNIAVLGYQRWDCHICEKPATEFFNVTRARFRPHEFDRNDIARSFPEPLKNPTHQHYFCPHLCCRNRLPQSC